MQSTVTVTSLSTRSRTGAPTYSTTAIKYRARVVDMNERVTDAAGHEFVASHKVFLASTVMVGLDDKVALPDGTTKRVRMVSGPRDEDGGIHHVRVIISGG